MRADKPHKSVLSWNVRAGARRAIRLAGTASILALVAGAVAGEDVISSKALAQNIGEELFGQPANPNAQMLLEADRLIYNDDQQSVQAAGNVQIAYDGYTLVAQRVTYHRNSGRVLAQGNVEIVEPDGNRIFADEIDITDNFSDGFVSALRVETVDNTKFAADSAERLDGNVTILNNGVYTACETCKENPDKPVFWQIRARKVTVDKNAQKISYEKATFELFGKPIAYLPYFSHADPAIKRKSGLLFPSVVFREDLGIGVTGSYFFNLAPNYDLTLSSTYYTRQGFLMDAEWRHRLENGAYNLQVVRIDQKDRLAFDANTYDQLEEGRMAIQSSGKFALNSRWNFGWQWLWQSDRNFARTYGVTSQTGRDVTNEVYLTGLSGKNYFDARTQKFLVQEDDITNNLQPQQATVLPVVDHNYIFDGDIGGGQLSYNFNLTSIDRHNPDIINPDGTVGLQANTERFHGLTGSHSRASAELEWKSNLITSNGLVVTPSLHGRVDGIWQDTDSLNSANNPLLSNESIVRGMPTAGLEIRYPLIAQDGLASHIFEPIAQVFASSDETDIGRFANEDAQSMVFDTTNLFSRSKFSGYDRIEGGVRANVGFRYSANFNGGGNLDIVAGQSFHLAGQNSFAQRDLVNAGLESGLETKRSDYVASAQLNFPTGTSLRAGGRFDEKNLDLRRAEVGFTYATPKLSASLNYTFIDAQPTYGFANDRHQASASGSFRLADYWRAFGAMTYDIETQNVVSDSIGLAYDDSCFSFSVAYSEDRAKFTGEQVNQAVTFSLGLRTIGNYGHKLNLDNYLE